MSAPTSLFGSRPSNSTLNANEEWKRKKKGFIIFSIVFFVVMAILTVEVIAYQNFNFETNGFVALRKMWATFRDPSNLQPCWYNPTYGYSCTLKTSGVALLIFVLVDALLWYDTVRHHHSLSGKENGSAKWNDDYKKFNAEYSETEKEQTTVLSKRVQLSMNTRKTQRNNNVLIVGGSGAGKSRFFVKPNVLQTNCNMVITDPSGELLESTGSYLRDQGYDIKVFNLVEMNKSHCYNPFHYIRDDQGVMMMINCLIRNTTPPEQHSGDPFWEKSETALLLALCFYLRDHRPVEEQNFATVMKLLRWAEVDENNANFESRLDKIFLRSKTRAKRTSAMLAGRSVDMTPDQDTDLQDYMSHTMYKDDQGNVRTNVGFRSLEELDPNETDIAVKQYKIFKMGAGKTAKSILISCAVRLGAFNIPQVDSLTRIDNIHLEELGGTSADEKKKNQALFVIIPAADSTYNFLVSMMYSQLFETLYYVAETSPACPKKRLPRHVKFLLDEFANIGTIPEFTKKLATMRKYEISCSVVLQNLAQIKTMYKDDWESIIGNCDSFVFLGGKEYTTLEYISKELGDQTITVKDRSMSARKGGDSQSYKQASRKLMFPDELGNLPNNNCIVMIRGLDPFYEEKYDYLAHPKYPFTSDADKSRSYSIQIDNSARDLDAIIMEVQQQQEAAKGPAVERVVSIEDLIAANPSWVEYPNVYAQFKVLVLDEDEEEEENKEQRSAGSELSGVSPETEPSSALTEVDEEPTEIMSLEDLQKYASDKGAAQPKKEAVKDFTEENTEEVPGEATTEEAAPPVTVHRKSFFDDEDDE